MGMIGKFMSPAQMEFRRFDPPEFAGFSEPGYGKVAFNFLVLPYGTGRSLLCTETRTATTDAVSAGGSAATGRSSARSPATSCGTG
jgi:hypothetical protein